MSGKKSYLDDDGEVAGIDAQWFKEAKRGRPRSESPKERVTIRLDADVVAFFKGDDPRGWQTRVNTALRKSARLK